MKATAGVPINLADRSKNPKWVRDGLKEWDRANPAEHLEAMQRRGELKNLKPSSWAKAYTPRISVSERIEDAAEGHGFRRGDRVCLSDTSTLSASLAGMPNEGTVTGIQGEFLRVGKSLYHHSMWRKA